MLDLVERFLDSVDASGGGWPVLVLLVVIAAIVYLARYVISRQLRLNEQRVTDRKMEHEQQLNERKLEFEAQLQRERENSKNYQDTTDRMVEAFNKNSTVIAEFSGILRPLAETVNRLDKRLEQTNNFRERRKPSTE